MTIKKITCLCLAVLFLMPMLFTGCGEETTSSIAAYTQNSKARVNEASVENDNYVLLWSDTHQRFGLLDKATNQGYYSAPMGYGADDEISAPVSIDYYAEDGVVTVEASGATACLAEDNYSSEQIENGFRAVYSFEEERIAVTVEYLLREDGLEIRIPMDGIQEDTNHIYEIKVAPFMATAKTDTGSYLMVPSGSGSLIYAKTSSGDDAKSYSEPIYGGDMSEPQTEQFQMLGQSYLPVFGAMNRDGDDSTPDTGMLGIIESGADCAVVNASNGGLYSEYANVYASFRIRSLEEVIYNNQGGTKATGKRFSEAVANYEYVSVRYFPLSEAKGEDITYNGMAARYRQYLQSRGYLQNRTQNVPALSVNMLGATQVTESFFGIPYQTDEGVTTLNRTQEILAELKETVGDNQMLVSLVGYGKGGLANTVIGGGYKLSSTVGKKSDLEKLRDYAAANGIVLSMDYESAQFQQSGSGISVGQNSARRVSTLKSEILTYSKSTGMENEKGRSWYLVTRDKIPTVMDKAIASVNKNGLSAISFGSLNRIVYSDSRTEGYVASSNFSTQIADVLKQNADMTVIASQANDYVALNADYITEVPMHSTKYSLLDEDIPFYAMVFQGYVPLSSSSINLAVNTEDTYLQAVATGMTLQFTLCDTLHDSIQFDEDTAFVSSRYADWKECITAMVKESAAVHAQVGNQAIVRYEKLGDLSFTTFENGVKVIVNYAEEAVTYNGVEIAANSFIVA